MSTISAMLESASRYPIPSKAEQLHLGALIQQGLHPDATPRQQRAGDRARRRLVERNARLAISVAKGFTKRLKGSGAMDFSDLIQESLIGLNTAALKFDPTRGYSFSTMATWWCRQAVARAVVTQATAIKMPNQRLDIVRRWRYREPEHREMDAFCEHYGYKPDLVKETLLLSHQACVRSLDAQLRNSSDADGCSLVDVLPSDDDGSGALDAIDAANAVGRLEVLPEELALVRQSLTSTAAEMARAAGVTRTTMSVRLKAARLRLAAVAGDESRELVA